MRKRERERGKERNQTQNFLTVTRPRPLACTAALWPRTCLQAPRPRRRGRRRTARAGRLGCLGAEEEEEEEEESRSTPSPSPDSSAASGRLHPPRPHPLSSPRLLDLADRLGVTVLDENRVFADTPQALQVRREMQCGARESANGATPVIYDDVYFPSLAHFSGYGGSCHP